MPIQPNRRGKRERRLRLDVAEPIERARDRRAGDRRDCERPIKKIRVQTPDARPTEHRADLSMNGVTFIAAAAPIHNALTISVRLPDMLEELQIPATISRARVVEGGVEIHARFLELDIRAELALARFIDARAQLAKSFDEAPGRSAEA